MQRPLPHDLLWGLTGSMLPADAPTWVESRLAANHPVVVRRDQLLVDRVAVGVRGIEKQQRYATWIKLSAITHCLTPHQLLNQAKLGHLALPIAQLSKLLQHWQWGITGSHAYQLATGEACVKPSSDLDLTVRMPFALGRAHAARLSQQLQELPWRLDVQLETTNGAVSLQDWASTASKVLLKTATGPMLVGNPWAQVTL